MKRILFSTLAASVLMLSCSKDHDENDAPAVAVKGKKLVYTDYNIPTTLSYNADGSFREAVYKAWGSDYKYSYSYEAGVVKYVLQNTTTNKNEETGTYTIVNGKPTAYSLWIHNANGDPVQNQNETYSYNSNGRLEKQTFNSGAYYLFFYNAEGDLSKRESYNAQGILETKTDYTYYDKEDKFPWYGLHNPWFFHFVMPPYAKHLLKTRSHTGFLDPSINSETTFSYEFDADGYVIKGLAHHVNAQQTSDSEWHNTYQ